MLCVATRPGGAPRPWPCTASTTSRRCSLTRSRPWVELSMHASLSRCLTSPAGASSPVAPPPSSAWPRWPTPPPERTPRADSYEPKPRQALHHLERSLFAGAIERVDPGPAVRLLEGGSPRAELELVAGEIRALLDEGIQPEEIAIVHSAPQTIAAQAGEVLADFNVPHSLQTSTPFSHTTLGRASLGILRCALGVGNLGDLLAWLRTPGVLEHPGLADGLEMSARTQGIFEAAGGLILWDARGWPLDRI